MNTQIKFIFALPLLFNLINVGCSHFERSGDSGYAKASTKSTKSGWRKIEANVTENKSLLAKEEPITDHQLKLKQLENSLSTRKEIEQYSRVLPWLKNDEEKLEFLLQPGFEARQKWLTENDMQGRIQRVKTQLKDLVEAQDIALGMPEELVKKSWGEPEAIDVSGNPVFKNQRWRYHKYVSTESGYKNEKKTVFFEGGKVVGWEVD